MRPALLALLLILASIPLASAEENHLVALGGAGTSKAGLVGFQWDDDSGIGLRYWFNMTGSENVELLVTTCIVLDSGAAAYCERHPLQA